MTQGKPIHIEKRKQTFSFSIFYDLRLDLWPGCVALSQVYTAQANMYYYSGPRLTVNTREAYCESMKMSLTSVDAWLTTRV